MIVNNTNVSVYVRMSVVSVFQSYRACSQLKKFSPNSIGKGTKKEILGGIGLQFLVVPTAVHKGVRRSAKIYI